MKKKAHFGTIFLSLILFACGPQVSTEYSDELTEEAEVVDLIYTPSIHGTDLKPTVGFTMNGDMTLGVASVDINIPEKYGVVFKCQHGKFVIQGSEPSYKDLWEKFSEGDIATIYYKEKYRVTSENEQVVSAELVDYDFLKAKKRTSPLESIEVDTSQY